MMGGNYFVARNITIGAGIVAEHEPSWYLCISWCFKLYFNYARRLFRFRNMSQNGERGMIK